MSNFFNYFATLEADQLAVLAYVAVCAALLTCSCIATRRTDKRMNANVCKAVKKLLLGRMHLRSDAIVSLVAKTLGYTDQFVLKEVEKMIIRQDIGFFAYVYPAEYCLPGSERGAA